MGRKNYFFSLWMARRKVGPDWTVGIVSAIFASNLTAPAHSVAAPAHDALGDAP